MHTVLGKGTEIILVGLAHGRRSDSSINAQLHMAQKECRGNKASSVEMIEYYRIQKN